MLCNPTKYKTLKNKHIMKKLMILGFATALLGSLHAGRTAVGAR